MKKISYAVAGLFLLLGYSCQKEETFTPVTGSSSPVKQTRGGDLTTMTYHYGDVSYEVSAALQYDEEGNVTAEPVQNQSFVEVKEILEGMENPGLFFASPGEIYLYADQPQLTDIIRDVLPVPSPEAEKLNKEKDLPVSYYTCQPYYQMFRDVGLNDMIIDAQNGSGFLGGPIGADDYYNVMWIGSDLNDQISSIRVNGGTFLSTESHRQFLQLFHHINLSGENITVWNGTCGNPTDVVNLRDHWIWFFLFFGETWNDQISSYRAWFNFG